MKRTLVIDIGGNSMKILAWQTKRTAGRYLKVKPPKPASSPAASPSGEQSADSSVI